jgi:hypothetical protein
MGFVVEKVALWQVFSEYFGFPCQFSFHQLIHIHHLSSRAGTIGQFVADVPSGLSLTPPQEIKKKLPLVSVCGEIRKNFSYGEHLDECNRNTRNKGYRVRRLEITI